MPLFARCYMTFFLSINGQVGVRASVTSIVHDAINEVFYTMNLPDDCGDGCNFLKHAKV